MLRFVSGFLRAERKVAFRLDSTIPGYAENVLLQEWLPTLELAYEASKGRTVIEKLDGESQHCSYAMVVMMGYDIARDQSRARENVVHELGFFQGRYGRDVVCLLHEGGVNISTNLGSVVYCSFQIGCIFRPLYPGYQLLTFFHKV